MKSFVRLLLVFGLITLVSSSIEAKSNVIKSPDYTIRKDSLSVTSPVDTNKKTVIFPNPFNVFIINEKK